MTLAPNWTIVHIYFVGVTYFYPQTCRLKRYATRRRFERTCQSDGTYASDKYFVRDDKYLLVLLLRPEGMEYRHYCYG